LGSSVVSTLLSTAVTVLVAADPSLEGPEASVIRYNNYVQTENFAMANIERSTSHFHGIWHMHKIAMLGISMGLLVGGFLLKRAVSWYIHRRYTSVLAKLPNTSLSQLALQPRADNEPGWNGAVRWAMAYDLIEHITATPAVLYHGAHLAKDWIPQVMVQLHINQIAISSVMQWLDPSGLLPVKTLVGTAIFLAFSYKFAPQNLEWYNRMVWGAAELLNKMSRLGNDFTNTREFFFRVITSPAAAIIREYSIPLYTILTTQVLTQINSLVGMLIPGFDMRGLSLIWPTAVVAAVVVGYPVATKMLTGAQRQQVIENAQRELDAIRSGRGGRSRSPRRRTRK
jgi:hypothetical protein